ncbi:MAG TPA: MerR family DNA-binding transcriptional regulator, partial [Candidatus Acidoferrales bacterium]|nr:MerR family DNA-binding transcriptional regulator [Candidatus Acidoferrales bacterium]
MRDALTISAFAKRSGVPSKTIRYWEGLGLLPKAARSHTGYRVFDPAALRYVSFVQKSKAIGLTLAEM